MATQAKAERDRKKILDRVWDEVKKINWQEVNKKTNKNFYIGLVGDSSTIQSMKAWLKQFPEKLNLEDFETPLKTHFNNDENEFEKHIETISIKENGKIDVKSLRNATFCIVQDCAVNEIRSRNVDAYIFSDKSNDKLAEQILDNHSEIIHALCYHFPVFRMLCTEEKIKETAMQNASWAIVTAAPNIVSGPHQAVSAPIEAISDFAVLTGNEIKMTFELAGISGRKVQPLKLKTELAIVLGLAKVAEISATNVTGKVPAGAGIAFKGAVAYGFTWAIGEAVMIYIYTGKKVTGEFFEKRLKKFIEKGKDISKTIWEKSKRKRMYKKIGYGHGHNRNFKISPDSFANFNIRIGDVYE